MFMSCQRPMPFIIRRAAWTSGPKSKSQRYLPQNSLILRKEKLDELHENPSNQGRTQGRVPGVPEDPKRNQLLRAVIGKEAANAKKQRFWVYKMGPKAWSIRGIFWHVTFYRQDTWGHLPERLFQYQYINTPWNWNGESRNKACSLLNAVLRFPFLITQVTAMKCLSLVKPQALGYRNTTLMCTRHTAKLMTSKATSSYLESRLTPSF